MYLYSTKISGNDLTDFETNFKSQAVYINELVIAETTFVEWLSYTQFKNIIVDPLAWADVKYKQIESKYILHLALESPI